MASRAKDTVPERLASIEARFDAFMLQQAERHRENQQELKDLQVAQASVRDALAKYRGFWGAFLLIGSALATAVTLFGDLVRKKLGWE